MKTAVIINDTSYKPHHGCETVVHNIIFLLHKRDIETIATNQVGISWDNKDFLNHMKNADIVIVNGEGTLHHAGNRAKDLARVGQYVKEHLFKPVVLINTIYQDNGPEIGAYMKYFDLIFVRESFSQIELKKIGILSYVVPDMTFYTPYDLADKHIVNDIGVSDSVYSSVSKKLYNFCMYNHYRFLPILSVPKINKFNYCSSWLKLARFLILKWIKIILLKLGIPLSYKQKRFLYFIESYKDYINTISNLKLFISGRFHSLCFALKTMTPFIAIRSNSHKIEGMLADIGIGYDRILEVDDIEECKLKKYIEWSDDESTKIHQYINEAPLKIEEMFDKILVIANNVKLEAGDSSEK
ncbi:MAG: polysaccharide pyruvyl transferase family protein [Campylobacterales bacterium]|nr:polysaccharide pyruvyl transferase family protein [Campylobacterales bacterium]